MFNKYKPISISLSPNVQKDDVALALKLIFQPWKWKKGNAIKELENNFKKYLGVTYAVSFNSGRSSLFAILKALNLPEENNVLLQAFTCNTVVNPILWANLNPVYVDCSDDFNINPQDLDSLIRANKGFINKKVSVLVLQHTFGLPANINEIISIVRESDKSNGGQTIIIEDCAHALGAELNGHKVGTFSDVAFFSFSRDKVISSVYGGIAVTNNDEIGKKLEELQKEFGQPSLFWIKQQLLHPILLHYVILPLYNFFDLGKIFLVVSQWLHILSKAVHWKEKRGQKPDYFPKALPNALALMANNQFNKLEKYNEHRQKIAEFYYQELAGSQFVLPKRENNIFLRFAIHYPPDDEHRVPGVHHPAKAHEIIYEAWHKENILLGDWYTSVIAPDDTKLNEMKYIVGMCPTAEKLAKETLNLPTHINISQSDAQRIVKFLKKY